MTLSPRNQTAITDFQRGSYSAVKELYEKHYTSLIDFATQLTRNKTEAHKIVQETFIKLFGMRERFHTEADIKAFLYITVRNICFAYIKSEKENEPGAETTCDEQVLTATARYDEEAVRMEALQKMQNLVSDLPEPEQTVFRSVFCDRLTIPAAAEKLRLTTVTVTQHRINAIRLLRNSLLAADLFDIPLFIYFVAVFCSESLTG